MARGADLEAAASEVLMAATAFDVPLRLLGSLAIKLRCPASAHLLDVLERREYRDLDFVGRAADLRAIVRLFESLRYTTDAGLAASHEYGIQRLIFHGPAKVDVFLDTLWMAHRLDLRDRLLLDTETVPLADLLLSKLQIHEFTDNDAKDLIILIAEHDVGRGAGAMLDLDFVVDRLHDDWGFWYDAINNLAIVDATTAASAIPDDTKRVVAGRVSVIRDELARVPKGLRWRARSHIGTRALWYQEVEDVER